MGRDGRRTVEARRAHRCAPCGAFASHGAWDRTELAGTVRASGLLVYGTRELWPLAGVRADADAPPDVGDVAFDGAGHHVWNERRSEVTAMLEAFAYGAWSPRTPCPHRHAFHTSRPTIGRSSALGPIHGGHGDDGEETFTALHASVRAAGFESVRHDEFPDMRQRRQAWQGTGIGVVFIIDAHPSAHRPVPRASRSDGARGR